MNLLTSIWENWPMTIWLYHWLLFKESYQKIKKINYVNSTNYNRIIEIEHGTCIGSSKQKTENFVTHQEKKFQPYELQEEVIK